MKDIAKPMFAFQNDNMEMYTLEKDLKVFGIEVENFPEGIGDAFDKLVTMISEEVDRSYFGISEMTEKGLHIKRLQKKNTKVKQKTIIVSGILLKKVNT
ncbi:MAG: hypothetical protein H0V65_02810 [Chitinophagales bacterium]|nr:hypothetical protein [Chitinophagales bacterium]